MTCWRCFMWRHLTHSLLQLCSTDLFFVTLRQLCLHPFVIWFVQRALAENIHWAAVIASALYGVTLCVCIWLWKCYRWLLCLSRAEKGWAGPACDSGLSCVLFWLVFPLLSLLLQLKQLKVQLFQWVLGTIFWVSCWYLTFTIMR